MAEGMDFRQVHEIVWRVKLLEKAKADTVTTDEMIAGAKEDAFKTVLRLSRLTNGLVWNKDLSYYNGALLQWRFIQENKGDYEMLAALFYGKLDPSNDEHERMAYEAHSIG